MILWIVSSILWIVSDGACGLTDKEAKAVPNVFYFVLLSVLYIHFVLCLLV